MQSIEIALAADGGYFDQLFVTATSMAAYCRTEDAVLSFNILDGGIATADWKCLVGKVVELHPKSTFNKIPVDQELFEKFPAWNGNRMAYARLLLPEALKDKDWVLYSDCDFLWLCDVAELWKERNGQYAIFAVRDRGGGDKERPWFAQHGYTKNIDEYFCSGMCLMNLKIFRECSFCGRIFRILQKHSDISYPDQTALNIVCAGREKMVDSKWGCFTLDLSQDVLQEGCALHYAGETPWRFVGRTQVLSDTMLLWHLFFAKMHNKKTWWSLRLRFSALQILWHRMFALLSRNAVTRFGVLILCGVSRHSGYYDFFYRRGLRLSFCGKAMGVKG